MQNNDEQHFVPPWQYDGSREEAAEYLISIVTGALFHSPPSVACSRVTGFAFAMSAVCILFGIRVLVFCVGRPLALRARVEHTFVWREFEDLEASNEM